MSSSSLRAALVPKPGFQIIFSSLVSLIAAVITWSISADNSPLYEYVVWHSWLPNLWGMLNFIPLIFGLLVSGNVHAPSEAGIMIGVVIQWFIVGFLLSILLAHLLRMFRRS